MKKIVLILDPPHGKEVLGKRSPDGKHEEWFWGRERLKQIEILAKAHGFRVEWTTKGDSEVGLTTRVKAANKIKVEKGQIKLFILYITMLLGMVLNEWKLGVLKFELVQK